MVKALHYKPACRGFDSLDVVLINGIFQWRSFRLHYGPGVYSASNRNEYQEHFLEVKAVGA